MPGRFREGCRALNGLAWAALWLGVASAWVPAPAWAWRAGAILMLAHVLHAFGSVHGWSHDAAVEATARQVEAVTGWRLGAGVWANHAFLATWWVVAVSWPGLGAGWRRAWWALFVFMGFNAAVVFVAGPARWLGWAWAAGAVGGMARAWQTHPTGRQAREGPWGG